MPSTPAEPSQPFRRPREPQPATGARQPLPPSYNRDDEMKPGEPPRTAYEPEGSEGSTRTAKTLTDPATGEPNPGAPAPAGSALNEADQPDQ
jgi:hypothetical protein